MSDLVRPSQGKYRIIPPKDRELNEYLLKLNAYDHYTPKLRRSGDYPVLDVKIDGYSANAGGYLIDNDLLCDALVDEDGQLLFVLTSQGSGPSRRWTLEKGRLYTPTFNGQLYVTSDDIRALLRQILSQR